ncbi:MAG: hypothetical protein JOY83_24915 [Alphaproteobacteria bacterium]|nr:hypothetical protein [Alphaproteobacteria bacterium]
MDEATYRTAVELRNRLRAELEQNVSFIALQHAEAVVALWERAHPAPVPSAHSGVSASRSKVVGRHSLNSDTSKVLAGAAEYLELIGRRATSREILEALSARGIKLNAKDPMTSVSSSLSHSPMFNNVLGLGYGLAEWPMTEAEAQAISRKAPTKAVQMWAAICDFLKSRGIAHRQEILDHLVSLGLVNDSPKAMGNLAAFMSDMKQHLVKHGEGRWSLAEDVAETNEAPNSSELFGASRGNGALPLQP